MSLLRSLLEDLYEHVSRAVGDHLIMFNFACRNAHTNVTLDVWAVGAAHEGLEISKPVSAYGPLHGHRIPAQVRGKAIRERGGVLVKPT